MTPEEMQQIIREVPQAARRRVYRHFMGEIEYEELTRSERNTVHYLKVQMAMIRIKAQFPDRPEARVPIAIIERALLDLYYTDPSKKDYKHYRTAMAWRQRLKPSGWLNRHLEKCGFPRHRHVD